MRPNTEEPSNNSISDQFLIVDSPTTSEQELDHSFDLFATGRLQSPEDQTTDCKSQQNTPCSLPSTPCINKETPLKTSSERVTNISPYSLPAQSFTFIDPKDTCTQHFFTNFLDTIPENSLEHDNKPFTEAPEAEMNTDILHESNTKISCEKFNSSSPDPSSSSGIGSSAEEDGLSCFSSCSASDKLSSSEEMEVQHFESSFEKHPAVKSSKASQSEEESSGFSFNQQTVIEKDAIARNSTQNISSVTSTEEEIDSTDTENPNRCSDPDLLPNKGASIPLESELSPTLPPVFVVTSSPGPSNSIFGSPFESTNVADQDQLSPDPVALFTDFPNTNSVGLSPDTSLSCTNTSDRTCFAHSLFLSADSQEYLTCLTHATSGQSEKSPNAKLCKEEISVQMANDTATEQGNFYNTSKAEEIQSVGQNGVFGDFSAAAFETNFTSMDNFIFKYSKPPVMEKAMFTEDINGIFFVEQISVQEATNPATNPEDFTTSSTSAILKAAEQNERLFGENNAFETNFTELNELQSPNEVFNSFLNPQKEGLFGDVKENKFESNFTASVNYPISKLNQDLIVEDVFTKNPNGGFFDDWAGAKIESDYTAGTFNLQSSKEEVLDDINRGLFESEVTFDSMLTAEDLQATKQEAPSNVAFSMYQNQVFHKADNVESKFSVTEAFPLSNDPRPKVERALLEHTTLQRSQSEVMLAPAFADLQLSAFGSDPELASSSKPQPDLLLFSPFPLALTPQCSSSPIALCPVPPLPVPDAARPESPSLQPWWQPAANQHDSPHLVKPLTTATAPEEKRTESRSMLEKLKFTRNTAKSSQEESEKKKALTEGAGSYYHLNHSELVALLVQREAELEQQKVQFERQKILLSKRETELRKLKPQVRDLEDYIDTLLVRIMEQKPTLLQVRSKFK